MLASTPPHTKVKTVKEYSDGSAEINSHSTFKELSSVKQEVQRSFPTSKATLAADLIFHSEMMRNAETPELTLHITTDKLTGEPNFIVKTWIINKEYYGR